MSPIIEVSNLSKLYKLSHQEKSSHRSIRDDLVNSLKGFFLRRSVKYEDFWAIKDVSFKINRGEVVGIIGRNGAGKSTLLKILSRVTDPTCGQVIMRGRVSSLLEVGTGFHPELSGRENIFLNGAILGMSRKEISRKFDQIVAFAGIEKFLDTPVKHYSSGMYVRLAFSVAAHLEPDILIVDEVLSVGDAEFQKKSLGKMDEVTRQSGRTIIFVSHNMEAIQKLCAKCILLRDGKVEMFDRTDKVIKHYMKKENQPSDVALLDRRDRTGRGAVKFTGINITDTDNKRVIKSGQGLRIRLDYVSQLEEKIKDVRVVLTVVNEDLRPVLRLDSDVTESSFESSLKPKGEVICETGPINLSSGRYFTDVDFLIKGMSQDYVQMASEFEIQTSIQDYHYKIKPDKSITDSLIKFSFRS